MHTVVITESERERRFTNEINKAVRHCRVVNVKSKVREGKTVYVNPSMPSPMLPPKFEPNRRFTSGGYVPTTSSGDVPLVPAHGVMM